MIRSEDLGHFIASVSAALAGPIMNDLRSEPVKAFAGAVLAILDRIASDVADGDAITAAMRADWQRVAAGTAELIGLGSAGDATIGHWRDLDAGILTLQKALADRAAVDRLVARLSAGDARAEAWMADSAALLVGLNRAFEDSWAAQARAVRGAAGADPQAVLRERLAAYLTLRYPALPTPPIDQFAIVAGGSSKLTALFTLAPNDVLPRRLALRMDVPNAITEARLDTEYPVLERVHAIGLPVPQPILFEPDEAHLGNAFMLSTQILDARMAGSCFPEDRRREGANMGPGFGREAAKLLAELHARTLEPQGDDGTILAETTGHVARQAAEWRSMDKPPFSLALDLGIAWMAANPLPLGRPVCLIHGDYAPHNIMTRDGRLVALLDWELARRGDPAEDLAECRMMLIDGCISWDEFVAVYLASGGPPAACDPHAVAYYGLVVYLKHGVNQTRLRSAYLRGERTDFTAAICASHYQDRLTLYQSQALQDATAVTADRVARDDAARRSG